MLSSIVRRLCYDYAMSQKTCPQCKVQKPLMDYPLDRRTKNGHHHWCRQCISARKRVRRIGNPEAARRQDRIYNLRIKMLNEDRFEKMWDLQQGLCAICATQLTRVSKGHAIDHCHSTQRVRDLLCHACNLILGHAKDDPARLRAAADYIERHAARTDQPSRPPLERQAPVYESDGFALTAKEWAARSGISATTLHWRRARGISLALPSHRGRRLTARIPLLC